MYQISVHLLQMVTNTNIFEFFYFWELLKVTISQFLESEKNPKILNLIFGNVPNRLDHSSKCIFARSGIVTDAPIAAHNRRKNALERTLHGKFTVALYN